MQMRIQRLPFSASVLLASLLGAQAGAEELFSCGANIGQVLVGNPAQGDFEFIGACGGPAQSLALVGSELFIGDTNGNLYHWQPGDSFVGYAFTANNDAAALLAYQGDVIVGGSDGSVLRYTTGGTLLESYVAPAGITSMLSIGSVLYLGSPFGLVFTLDLADGTTGSAGTCGGPVQAMVLDPEHGAQGELVISASNGFVYRLDLATQSITAFFQGPNDGSALALHMGDLLIGGVDGSLLRIDGHTGIVLDTLATPNAQLDVQALVVAAQPEPGVDYCYGIGCPCGNDDPQAGCVNNTGSGARLRSSGSASVSTDDLFLTVSDVPPGQFARFYMGAGLNNMAFGNGLLCAGSGAYGQFRFEVTHSGQGGFLSLGLGIVAYSEQSFGSLGHIFSGQTWHFQAWYRDPGGPCGSSFNTSNGVSVVFLP